MTFLKGINNFSLLRFLGAIRDLLIVILRSALRRLLCKRDFANTDAVPDLAPIICKEGNEHYAQQLEVYLNRQERVKGIAVTGPYASGKSTFLNTYQYHHPELKFINISLANFDDEEDVGKESQDKNSIQIRPTVERLEHAVLKQLLYRENDGESRGSRFVRASLTTPSRLHTIASTCTVAIWVATLLFAKVYGTEKALDWTQINLALFAEPTLLFCWFAAFMVAVPTLLLADLLRHVRQLRVSKLNPLSGDIELQGKGHDSVFNLYLEDVLTYFSHSKVDVVIFEDLDRFECHRIFERLRELNKVLNDSNVVSQHVRFIYALSDDVFKGADRTKFFDAIVPILPVVAGANAYPQFKQLLTKAGVTAIGNTIRWDELCRTITLYIQEMRLLKSIVAEFLLYRKVLELNDNLDSEAKLLAFIAYKNLHSDDFALCQEGKGILVKQIQKKKAFIAQKHHIIEDQISDLRQEENDVEREHLSNQRELAELMLYKLNNPELFGLDASYHPFVSIEGIYLSCVENPVDSVASLFKTASEKPQHQNAIIIVNSGARHGSARKISNILDLVMPDYQARIERLKNKNIEVRQTRQKKLKQLQQEQQTLSLLSLAQCLKQLPSHEIAASLKDKPMLHALLITGFIDEDYGFYLSAHVEGHLTKQDMDLLRALKGLTAFDQNYKSSNYKEMIKFMNGEACASTASYNLGLIEYLSESSNSVAAPLLTKIIQHQFKDHSDGIERLAQQVWSKQCFKNLVLNWPNVITILSNNQTLASREKAELLIKILLTAGEVRKDDSAFIQSIIGDRDDSLEIVADSDNASNALSLLADARVKLEAVNTLPSLYVVTREALKYQVLHLNSVTLVAATSAIIDGDVTTLPVMYAKLPITDQHFKSFLHSDFYEYARLIRSGVIFEVPVTVIASILNDDFTSILSDQEKLSLINELEFVIEDLSIMKLNKCQLIALIKKFRIAPTWENATILVNFCNGTHDCEEQLKESAKELSATLQEFFQDQRTKTALCSTADELGPGVDEFVNFIESVEINNDDFTDYIEATGYQYGPETIECLHEDKSEMLIRRGLLSASFELYEALIAGSQNHAALVLIEFNESIFFQSSNTEIDGLWLSELEFSPEDLSFMIVSDHLSIMAKEALLRAHQAQILEVADPKGWLHLILPPQNKDKIYGQTIRKSDLTEPTSTNLGIIPAKLVLESKVLSALLAKKAIPSDDKVRLLIGQMAHLNDGIWSVLGSWETKPDYLQTTSRLENKGVVNAFCCALVYHELVSSLSIINDKLQINYYKDSNHKI